MMYGRGYNGFGRGFSNAFGNCFGLGSGFSYGGWGMIFTVALILLAVAAIVYFTKGAGRRQSSSQALETLKMRFAQGEISEEEYIKRKNILS